MFTIKKYSEFVNENLNTNKTPKKRLFEAEETKQPSETEIKKAMFQKIAFPTTKEEYSKLLSTITGKGLVATGSEFSLIRDFIIGLSNDAISYSQVTSGQEENMKKGILTINVRPLKVAEVTLKEDEIKTSMFKLSINTKSEELANTKTILDFKVEVGGQVIPLRNALLLPLYVISGEGKYIWATDSNQRTPADLLKASVGNLNKNKTEMSNVLALWDSKEEVIKRVNTSAKNNEKIYDETLASVGKDKKLEIINSYDNIVKGAYGEKIEQMKTGDEKKPDVAPKIQNTGESRRISSNNPRLNEAKSCKGKVSKFLKDNGCEVDYEAGTCKMDGKSIKIEKALLKLKAPETLIKSYTAECEKEVNEALRLMRRR